MLPHDKVFKKKCNLIATVSVHKYAITESFELGAERVNLFLCMMFTLILVPPKATC